MMHMEGSALNRIVGIILAITTCLVLAGCSKGPSIVGQWQMEMSGSSKSVSTEWFYEDGTYKSVANVGKHIMTATGTWQIDGEQLSIDASLQDVDTETGKVREMPHKVTYQVKWIDEGKVILTDAQGSFTFVRGGTR
jgi:hypothetical protein